MTGALGVFLYLLPAGVTLYFLFLFFFLCQLNITAWNVTPLCQKLVSRGTSSPNKQLKMKHLESDPPFDLFPLRPRLLLR